MLKSGVKKISDQWKRGVNWIENKGENLYKMLKKQLNNIFWWKIRPTLGPSVSGTKCDIDKPFFSAEKRGQSDSDEA